MNKLKDKELEILTKICHEHNLPFKLVQQLISSAEKFTYENTTANARKKEYQDLIDFYSKRTQGD